MHQKSSRPGKGQIKIAGRRNRQKSQLNSPYFIYDNKSICLLPKPLPNPLPKISTLPQKQGHGVQANNTAGDHLCGADICRSSDTRLARIQVMQNRIIR